MIYRREKNDVPLFSIKDVDASNVQDLAEYSSVIYERNAAAFALYERIGMRPKTNAMCGKLLCYAGCKRPECHDGRVIDGIDYTGKGVMFPIFYSCDKATCEICGLRSWRGRAARNIDEVLTAISKLIGLPIEHVIISIHWSEWHVPIEELRARAVKALRFCGVLGEVPIPHADRHGRIGIHFHCLCFIKGGYICRDCEKHSYASEKTCYGCSGLEGLARKVEAVSGYTVKVAVDREGETKERKSVRQTASYQLSHASVPRGVDGFRLVTYSGICSNRGKGKIGAGAVKKKKLVCPVCEHKIGFFDYFGFKQFLRVPSWRSRGLRLVDRSVDLLERGKSVWAAHVAGGSGESG